MPEDKKNEINIEIDEEVANGVYSNLVMISHTEAEFIFDFIFIQPQYGKAVARSRVITSPLHAKRMLNALNGNLAKYESQFGEIKDIAARMQDPKNKTTRYLN
ncbi:MAG: DUF3467 domain-containing protein [Elusimicrobiota bacterium]|jgi:hypothetical protein|nr:DUF3467 domain-containing protein [Elusimicrobiota bacterium]